jgi:hypothetical protein
MKFNVIITIALKEGMLDSTDGKKIIDSMIHHIERNA